MSTTFDLYSHVLDIPNNHEEHDYRICYSDYGMYITFQTIGDTIKHKWQCRCSFDELAENDIEEISSYVEKPIDSITIEDWFLSGVKIRYVGYYENY